MAKTLKTFKVGGRHYELVLFPATDTTELKDEDGETLLIFNGDAKAFSMTGVEGDFHLETVDGGLVWVYYENPLRTRAVYWGDLIAAEVEVGRRWILRNIPQPVAPIDSEGGHCD